MLVTSRFPLPVRRGNQVRTLQWMDALDDMQGVVVSPRPESPSLETDLREMGVELVTYSPSVLGRLAGLARATMSGRPLQEGIYDFGSARRAVAAALDRGDYDLVIVQMIRCGWAAEMVRTREDSPPILFDAIDAMSLHFRRGAQSRAWPLSSVARIEAARCARREGEMAGLADLTLAVASRD
ncbi:MAG: hypothetical protein GY906_40110, partial [bacterium]|nr:hypothetical protein [bacterium]